MCRQRNVFFKILDIFMFQKFSVKIKSDNNAFIINYYLLFLTIDYGIIKAYMFQFFYLFSCLLSKSVLKVILKKYIVFVLFRIRFRIYLMKIYCIMTKLSIVFPFKYKVNIINMDKHFKRYLYFLCMHV